MVYALVMMVLMETGEAMVGKPERFESLALCEAALTSNIAMVKQTEHAENIVSFKGWCLEWNVKNSPLFDTSI